MKLLIRKENSHLWVTNLNIDLYFEVFVPSIDIYFDVSVVSVGLYCDVLIVVNAGL